MPLPHHLPNVIRYYKARLRVLKRPMLWGSAAALLLAILLFSEYWNQSNWFGEGASDRPPTSGVASLDGLSDSNDLPSQEDSAIGIDIDSLPVLLNELNEPGQPPTAEQVDPLQTAATTTGIPSTGAQGTQLPASTQSSTDPATSLLAAQDVTDAQDAATQNPFAPDLPGTRLFDLNLSRLSPLNNESTNRSGTSESGAIPGALPGVAGIDLFSTTGQNPSSPTSLPSNPLQQAMQRDATAREQSTAQPSTLPASSLGGSQPNRLLAPQPSLPTQTLPYGQGLQRPASPQTSPPVGTTGYTLPPALRVPSGASNPYSPNPYSPNLSQPLPGLAPVPQIAPPTVPSQSGIGQSVIQPPMYGVNQGTGQVNPYNTTIAPSNPNPTPEVYQRAEPAPFSAPRSRGNGEINTFANP